MLAISFSDDTKPATEMPTRFIVCVCVSPKERLCWYFNINDELIFAHDQKNKMLLHFPYSISSVIRVPGSRRLVDNNNPLNPIANKKSYTNKTKSAFWSIPPKDTTNNSIFATRRKRRSNARCDATQSNEWIYAESQVNVKKVNRSLPSACFIVASSSLLRAILIFFLLFLVGISVYVFR